MSMKHTANGRVDVDGIPVRKANRVKKLSLRDLRERAQRSGSMKAFAEMDRRMGLMYRLRMKG